MNFRAFLAVGLYNNGDMFVASVVTSLLHELHKLPSPVVYIVVSLLVFSEAALFIGFILPGETAALVGGVVASQGRVNIGVLCAVVVAAAVVGDSVGYFIGERWGEKMLTLPIISHREVAIRRALENLQRRGPVYVFVGRFTAFLRAIMPGLAGMSKMHYRRFLMANALGGLIWGIGFTLIGYFAGTALNQIAKVAGWAALGLLIVVFVIVILLHLRNKKREARDTEEWTEEQPDNDATSTTST